MRFSLIMGTVDRVEPVGEFLDSLDRQTCQEYELIVVDQNEDDRLCPLVEDFGARHQVRHLRCGRGLSRARNKGIGEATGDLVAFPDDDCTYPPDLLETVSRFFDANPQWDGLTGKPTDKSGLTSMGRFSRDAGAVTYFTVWTRVNSFSIFVRSPVVQATGGFDETLGVGAGTPWGSAEEIDYVLRSLKQGFRLYYDPELIVFHPLPYSDFGERATNRHRSYGMGMGRTLAIHSYPLWFVAWSLLRPLGGTLIFSLLLKRDRARYHLACFLGRLKGWLSWPSRKGG